MTEAQLRAIDEFNGDFINRVGVPDTKAGLRTRANASWPRLIREIIVQINEIGRGTISVPGIAMASGAKWRPGDDGAQSINDLSVAAYSIATPTSVWSLDDTDEDVYSVVDIVTTGASPVFDIIYSPVAAKGQYTLADNITYGGRTYYQAALATSANYAVPVVCAASITFRASQWNQANDGIVLLSIPGRPTCRSKCACTTGTTYLQAKYLSPGSARRQAALGLRCLLTWNGRWALFARPRR
jgi:hypothetical protein